MFDLSSIYHDVKVEKVSDYASADTAAIETTEVDMQGFDGVCWIGCIHTYNSSNNYVKVQQDTATGMASATDLEGTKVTPTANNETFMVDVFRPLERFVRLYVTRGTSSSVGEIYALKYRAAKRPVDNDETDTIIGEYHASPDEGTA